MIVYYYVDNRGHKHGSLNAWKIEQMANQNYAISTGTCSIYDFEGIFHNFDWQG